MGLGSSSGAVLYYDTCEAAHTAVQCSIFVDSAAPIETVYYVSGGQRGQRNPYGTTYNQGWRNHQNFSWNFGTAATKTTIMSRSSVLTSAIEKKFTTEDVLAKFMINTEVKFQNINNQPPQHGRHFN